MEISVAQVKAVKQLTRQYAQLKKRIADMEDKAKAIKAQVQELAPEGMTTPYGVWQAYSESQRTTYTPAKMSALVEALLKEGKADIAERIVSQQTQSIIDGGIKFINAKPTK